MNAQEIIAAFNEICDTLGGRRLAVKIQTLLLQSPRGLGLINTFLKYQSEFRKRQGDDRELYDCAATGAFEYIVDEMNGYCGEITADERFNLFCFLSKISKERGL